MCFSATASFTASVTLTILSLLAFKQAKHRSTLLLASSPLIFALQQGSEGFVWLALGNPAWQSVQLPATYFFLFCALIWWPLWMPLTLTLLEPHIVRKKVLVNLLTFGVFFSMYMLFCLITYGATAAIEGCHIYYNVTIPGEIHKLLSTLYLIPAVVPFFVSSIWGVAWFGTAIIISYVISYIFYQTCFLSVWCFFAAVLSLMIIQMISHLENQG
jgi:hypothetical protein